jgi:DNA (cytosine-5)-methyltransferase 1
MITPQLILGLADELVVDLFAGGGGASTGIEQAIGRHVDIAVNHDPDAVGMHEVNHPQTKHYLCDVFEVDPLESTAGRPVSLLHASPDCTHHSQALGGQPRSRKIRALAWAVHKWVGRLRKNGQGPKVVTLENVKQMMLWSPLIAKRDKTTGRVVRVDGTVAAKGERVPVQEQWLVPDPKRTGQNWKHFIDGLRAMGATAIQWRVIVNADLGAHSTRERLYVIVRFDGEPIVWPEQTHAKKPKAGQKRWKPAADCIDWSIPGRSIFGREKPLADATMRRIAHGMRKFVLEAAEPFIVPATHTDASNRTRPLSEPMPTVTAANRGELMLLAPSLVPVTHTRDAAFDPRDPLRTITTAKGGETALTAALLVQAGHGEGKGATKRRSHGANDIMGPIGTVTASGGGQALAAATLVQMGYGEREGQAPRALDLEQPLGTVVAGGLKHGLSTAFMVQANGGFNDTPARDLRDPVSTVTTSGSQQQLIAAHLTAMRRHSKGTDVCDPAPTVTSGGKHHALVEYRLSKEQEEGALRCAAFLMRYHGTGGQWADVRDPMTTITTHDRLALVTVWLRGEPWVIVDICLRMLVPRELYNAQDFPASYVIDRTSGGKVLTKTAQVRMCGNSVSPLPMKLIVAANYREQRAMREAA